jgi:hypothetical protein
MLDHFDFIASIYDRLIGLPDSIRLRKTLKLPTTGWLLDGGGGPGGKNTADAQSFPYAPKNPGNNRSLWIFS